MNALDTLTPDTLTTPSDVLAGYRPTETFGSGSGHHRLICDDNLRVLKELDAAGEVFDFIFIDPPYNTGRTRDTYQNRFGTDQ